MIFSPHFSTVLILQAASLRAVQGGHIRIRETTMIRDDLTPLEAGRALRRRIAAGEFRGAACESALRAAEALITMSRPAWRTCGPRIRLRLHHDLRAFLACEESSGG